MRKEEEEESNETITSCAVIERLSRLAKGVDQASGDMFEMILAIMQMRPNQVSQMVRKCPDAAIAAFLRNCPDEVINPLILVQAQTLIDKYGSPEHKAQMAKAKPT